MGFVIDPILLPYMPKFINSQEEQISNLKSFVNKNDLVSIKKIIHTIKGNSGSYGLIHVTNICKEIEESMNKNPNYNILEKLDLIETFLKKFKGKL